METILTFAGVAFIVLASWMTSDGQRKPKARVKFKGINANKRAFTSMQECINFRNQFNTNGHEN